MLVHVDDLLAATKAVEQNNWLFNLLNKRYGIKEHERATQYLGVEIDRSESSYSLRQTQYTREVIDWYGFVEARKVGNHWIELRDF